jgi:hypothetical protein
MHKTITGDRPEICTRHVTVESGVEYRPRRSPSGSSSVLLPRAPLGRAAPRTHRERGKRLARDPAPLPHIPVADPLDTASTFTTFLGDVQITPPLTAPATGDSDEWGTLLNLLAHEANGMPGNGLQAGADTGVDLLQGLLAMPSNGHPSNDGWDSWMQFGNGV